MKDKEILSVSNYLDKLNTTLKSEIAKIVGEISGIQEYPGRSYMYFSLKDSKDQSTVKCFMWKNDYRISGVNLKDGMEIVVTAYPSIYKPNGGMTLQVQSVELLGEGALKIAYDQLKAKLEKEGLFDESKKRDIPVYPHRIGVITSKSGAVINDFLSNLGKFGFEILFVDSKVEGQDAVKDILNAIKTLKNKDLDVLVLMRGGGSLESFLAFNNEMVVRAIADFPVPTLTGIGHDKDIPLVSFVSDKNVSTPTAVTHIINKGWSDLIHFVNTSEEKIYSSFDSLLNESRFDVEHSFIKIEKNFDFLLSVFKSSEESLFRALDYIKIKIHNLDDILVRAQSDLVKEFSMFVKQTQEIITNFKKSIDLSNPERPLAYGYSIVKSKGKVVKKVKDVGVGDEVDILVSDGIIRTVVE